MQQQRQLRLGDILDDYCPRDRRVTNHVVVAMVGPDVKQTRCTTCDADHVYKHAKVPRQRRKSETPAALYSQMAAGAPKHIVHDPAAEIDDDLIESEVPDGGLAAGPMEVVKPMKIVEAHHAPETLNELVTEKLVEEASRSALAPAAATGQPAAAQDEHDDDAEPGVQDVDDDDVRVEEGPVHRPLIRATLPRVEGQAPPTRPAPDFTIRQPGGRPGKFRPRHQRGPEFGPRSNGNAGGRPQYGSQGSRGPQGSQGPHGSRGAPSLRPARPHGRKRSK